MSFKHRKVMLKLMEYLIEIKYLQFYAQMIAYLNCTAIDSDVIKIFNRKIVIIFLPTR